MALRVYLGVDPRPAEMAALAVAELSARRFGCEVIRLQEDRLRATGIITRPVDPRGVLFDLNSGAACSTAFAIARFAVPLIAHDGWALFADCDVLFNRDPHELLSLVDDSKAVWVVQHPPIDAVGAKMDGQPQQPYARKLWSSVTMWNCAHPANRRLNLTTLNQWPGRDLHAFGWLADSEIGALPAEWNHLVGINPKAETMPALLHYTQGVPVMAGYENCEYAAEWREMAEAT